MATKNNTTKTGFLTIFSKEDWTAASWFRFLSAFLVIWIILYLLLHLINGVGHEYQKLSPDQLKNVVWLIDDSANAAAKKTAATPSPDTATNDSLTVTPDTTNTKTDSAKPKQTASDAASLKCEFNDSCGFSKAAVYINEEFDGNTDAAQMNRLMCYLCNESSKEVTLFLTDTKFKIESYFWLTGGWAYLEVIFWVIIGVICSLLYYVGDKNRNATTIPGDPKSVFDATEIPYQVAKFFYAPCSTLVLILGYSFLQGDNLVDINASKGMIVFAFISGFYSGRTMNFLDRLKELLLPLGSEAKTAAQQANAIQIELLAAEPSLTEEQKNHIIETGMGGATVTLQAEGSADIITATKTGEEQESLFQVTNIAAGKYSVQAKFAGKFEDDDIINLEATQTIDITKDTTEIKLNMLKAKSDG
ncbi:MAG: hypothetical protein ABI921_02870 [Panacibacter sp.]